MGGGEGGEGVRGKGRGTSRREGGGWSRARERREKREKREKLKGGNVAHVHEGALKTSLSSSFLTKGLPCYRSAWYDTDNGFFLEPGNYTRTILQEGVPTEKNKGGTEQTQPGM